MTTQIYPVQRSGNLFLVKAAVGRAQAQPSIIRLLVDTGAGQTGLSTTLLVEIGYPVPINSPAIVIMTGNGMINVPIVQIPWLHCLGQQLDNFSVLALTLPTSRYFNGILGMDFLKRFNAVIDVGKAQITLP